MTAAALTPAEALADLLFDETAHLYTLAGKLVPGVTRVLEAAGMIDYSFLGARRFYYLERGRKVHQATHADDEGALDESGESAEIMGYVEAWRSFRRDYGFTPNRIERRVCHRRLGYAGTLDRTGYVRDGSEIILDIKSGIAPPAVRHQLAAYAACLPHPRTRRRRCVEVHADGTYRVIAFETGTYQRDFDTFRLALDLMKRMEEL
jgi:hypothetical protein